MEKRIGKTQEEYLGTIQKMLPVLLQMQERMIRDNEEIGTDELQLITKYGELLAGTLKIFGYMEKADIISQVNEMNSACVSKSSLALLFEQLLEATQVLTRKGEKGQKRCSCCGQKVYYWPLSDYYAREAKKYHYREVVPQLLNEEEYTCPCCMASDRDRVMVSFLEWLELQNAAGEESLLQIAPAKPISHWIYGNCPGITYHTTDLYMQGVTFQTDIQDMKEVSDESYNYIICSHVLEHVQDDRKAMRELHRILKPDGMVLFLVPIALNIEHIDEEWGLTEAENWHRFGQGDHCRLYAQKEMVERLQESGFCVRQLGKEFFGEKVFWDDALEDGAILYVLTKTEEPLETMLGEIKRRRMSNASGEGQNVQPLVSVILPSYNHEKYVSEAIESVLNQTYKNIEFLVSDDGSSDGTAEEILKYEDRIDQIHLLDVNTGGNLATHILLDNARGQYIAMMHSDDVWDPEKLDMQVRYMVNHPECEACFTGCLFIDSAGVKSEAPLFVLDNMSSAEWFRYVFEHGNVFCHPSIMIKRERYIELVQDATAKMFRQLPDFWYWLQLLQKSEIHVIEKELTFFRIHEEGYNMNTSARTEENIIRNIVEDRYIWYHVFKKMSDDFFVKAFEPYLRKKDNLTSELIMCEKFFVLLSIQAKHRRHTALFYLFDIYQIPGIAQLLEEQYDFTLTDLYKLTGEQLSV